MNISSMEKVTDVNKRSYSADLKYSENTEQWTMNEKVQDALNLDGSRGLNMYVGIDENTGEQVTLVEIVDSEEAEFFTGEGNVFIARRLADHVVNTSSDQERHSFALEPVENMDGEVYVVSEWEGESTILENTSLDMSNEEEKAEDYSDDLDEFAIDEDDKNDSSDTVLA